MDKKIFISYSHENSSKVKEFAFSLSLHGFDLWMDEKNISSGDNYISKIFNGIHDADIYLVFLSKSSLDSKWVNTEIEFALHEKIERNNFIIIPVLLEDIDIPVLLSNIDYLDARFSIKEAVEELALRYEKRPHLHDDIYVSSISFSIGEITSVELSPFNTSMDKSDLIDNRNMILAKLRKKAYGILMNFISASDFDFQSETPKFTNGLYEETVEIVGGTMDSSIRENIIVETLVFNPSLNKIEKLLKCIESFNINAITFSLSLPLATNENMIEVGKRCFQKIQENYIILSYDTKYGAKIQIKDDFYISILFSNELLKVRLSKRFGYNFEKDIKEFSVFDFIKNLLE